MTQAPPPRQKPETRDGEARVIGGHCVFATTVPNSQKDNDPRRAAEFYRI